MLIVIFAANNDPNGIGSVCLKYIVIIWPPVCPVIAAQ